MNFENLTVGLYVLIIFSILENFQENKKSKTMSSIKCLKFKFLWGGEAKIGIQVKLSL